MRHAKILIGLFIVVSNKAVAQQGRTCPTTTYFEYQVAEPALWIRDTTLAVHPSPADLRPANLVQFVIDTAGVPVPRTFKALKITDSTLVIEAQRSFANRRFRPAVLNGCKVRQLVQTAIVR